jgi:hypothetical protein
VKNNFSRVTGNTRGGNMRILIIVERMSDELVSCFDFLHEKKYGYSLLSEGVSN